MTETASDVSAPPVAILRGGTPLEIVEHGGSAVAIAWPGTGSRFRAMHRIDLEPRGSTVLLRHESEAAYFVATGSGRVGDLPLPSRSAVYVPRRAGYRFEADERTTIYGGPCPPDPALYGVDPATSGDGEGDRQVRVLEPERDGVPLPMISQGAWLVVWPGMGAEEATMNVVTLEPGEENQAHVHEASDDTIAILAGKGSIDDLTSGEAHEFEAGDVVFVRAGIRHKVKANRGARILSAGGPCPPDYGMLKALGLV